MKSDSMNIFTLGKIYTIRSDSTNKFYIGSTIQSLHKRLFDHKRSYTQYSNGNTKCKYCTSFDIIECGDSYIELLENYPCNNNEELTKREGEFIRKFKNDVVNKAIAGRTDHQYYIDNKTYLDQQSHHYYQQNIEKCRKYARKYNEKNKAKLKEKNSKQSDCECGGKYTHSQKSSHFRTKKHVIYLEMLEQVELANLEAEFNKI